MKCRYKISANEKGLWQVGHLKLICPNVRRYKLLILNYSSMFKSFPSAEIKLQINYQCSITSVSPLAINPCWVQADLEFPSTTFELTKFACKLSSETTKNYPMSKINCRPQVKMTCPMSKKLVVRKQKSSVPRVKNLSFVSEYDLSHE